MSDTEKNRTSDPPTITRPKAELNLQYIHGETDRILNAANPRADKISGWPAQQHTVPGDPPEPLYPCAMPGCQEDRTRPAEDLARFSGREAGKTEDDIVLHPIPPGWYCGECSLDSDCSGTSFERDGPSLSQYLRKTRDSTDEEERALIGAGRAFPEALPNPRGPAQRSATTEPQHPG